LKVAIIFLIEGAGHIHFNGMIGDTSRFILPPGWIRSCSEAAVHIHFKGMIDDNS